MYVETIADMTVITTPSITDEVVVGGYYALGDLGGGNFIWIAGTRPPEDGGFVIYHSSNTSGWFQRIVTEAAINVRWFGAVADGVTDDLPAFQTIVDLIGTGGFETIFIPKGDYFLSDTLDIVDKTINIIGESGADATSDPSRLLFAAGVMGLQLRRTGAGYQESIVERIQVVAAGKSGMTDNHGVYVTQRATFRYVLVGGFKDNGFHAEGDLGGSSTDVSLSYFDRCRSSQNDGHGFFIDGSDANQCTFIICDAVDNGEWGFYDSSFLGNNFIGCHCNNNVSGPYLSDNANSRAMFIGCYSEEGSPTSEISSGKAMVLGGLHGSGITGGTQFVESEINFVTFANPDGFMSFEEGVFTMRGTGSASLIRFRSIGEDGITHFESNWANSGLPSMFSYVGVGAKLTAVSGYSVNRYNDYPTIQMREFYLQNQVIKSMPSIAWLVEEPGAYFAADLILNKNYNGATPQGWIGVENGTIGTFTEGLTATRVASDEIQLSAATTEIKVGYTIEFAGARATVMSILDSGTRLLLDRSVPNEADQPIDFIPPVFRAYGTGIGDTSKRPVTLGAIDAGYQYFDTDLNALIYWDGTDWVDTREVTGSSTQSGNGATTSFDIPHGLGVTPSYFNAVANNAATAGVQYITADGTNITVHYTTAPGSGSNNLAWTWIAKV